MHDRAFSDSEIFFTAVLAIASIVLGEEMVVAMVTNAGSAREALATRLGPPATVRLFAVFFVLLPAAIAFLGIGLPFGFRSLGHALRGSTPYRERLALGALLATVPLFWTESTLGGNGRWTLLAVSALALASSHRALAEIAERAGFRLLLLGGVSLGFLAYYQYSVVLGGTEPSRFIAPTALVAGFYFALFGSALVLLATVTGRTRSAASALMSTALAALWYASPRFAARAGEPAAGDLVELGVTATTAIVLVIMGIRSVLTGRAGRDLTPVTSIDR